MHVQFEQLCTFKPPNQDALWSAQYDTPLVHRHIYVHQSERLLVVVHTQLCVLHVAMDPCMVNMNFSTLHHLHHDTHPVCSLQVDNTGSQTQKAQILTCVRTSPSPAALAGLVAMLGVPSALQVGGLAHGALVSTCIQDPCGASAAHLCKLQGTWTSSFLAGHVPEEGTQS